MSYQIRSMVQGLFSAGPLYLAFLAALVMAAMNYKSHPKTAMRVGGAGALAIVGSFLCWLLTFAVGFLTRTSNTYEMASYLYMAVNLIRSVVIAGSFGLLIWAAFAERGALEEA